MSFLTGRFAIIVTILLAVQAFGSFAIDRRKENAPSSITLKNFPIQIAGWEMRKDYPMEEEVQKVLKATDYLVRDSSTQPLPGRQFFGEWGATPLRCDWK